MCSRFPPDDENEVSTKLRGNNNDQPLFHFGTDEIEEKQNLVHKISVGGIREGVCADALP